MNTYEKIMYYWEKGYFSLWKCKYKKFHLFSLRNGRDGFNLSWAEEDEREVLRYPSMQHMGKAQLDDMILNVGLQFVRAIHPSELMGEGLKKGDKIKVIGGAETWTVTGLVNPSVTVTTEIEKDECSFHPEDVEPYIEESGLRDKSDDELVEELKKRGKIKEGKILI